MYEVGSDPEQMDPLGEGIPFGSRLTELASADPSGIGLITVAADGSELALSWRRLNLGANQWARELSDCGAAEGSFVAIAIPNSRELVLSVLGCWKIGAVPITVRWDLPEWERSRLLAVIEPTVVIDEDNRSVSPPPRAAERIVLCRRWSHPWSTGSAVAGQPACRR